jgi:hypothetical protein
MFFDLLVCVFFIESLLFCFFNAAPLIWMRAWLVSLTPFLFSTSSQTHLFNCQICLGFYISIFTIIIYQFYYLWPIQLLFFLFISYRLAITLGRIFFIISGIADNLVIWRRRNI